MGNYNGLLPSPTSSFCRLLKNGVLQIVLAAGFASWGCAGASPIEENTGTIQEYLQQPSIMEARFFSVNSDQSITFLREQSYSRNWFRILPLELGQTYTSLLFYDRVGAAAKLYNTIGNGELSLVNTYSGWNQWDEVVPVRLSSTEQGLFFYDRNSNNTRLGRLYKIGSTGTLTHLGDQDLSESGRPRGFDALVAGYFATAPSTGTQDVLGYDRDSGKLATLVKGSSGMTIQAHSASVGTHWDQMIAGNFAGDSRTDVMLYDRDFGRSVLLINSSGSFTAQTEQTTWAEAEHRVFVAGEFGGDAFTDLLVYDGRNSDPTVSGQGQFYVNSGTGAFSTASKTYSDWRKTWATIVPGRFDGIARDDLLFYENTYYIKLTVVQPKSGSSTRTVTDATVRTWIDGFNRTFSNAGLYISEFEKVTVTNQTMFDSYCGKSTDEADKEVINSWVATNKPNNLVIVLPHPNGTVNCSGTDWRFAWANGSDVGLITHELGHYMHLPHAMDDIAHAALKKVFECGTTIDQVTAEKRLGAAVATLEELDWDSSAASWAAIYDTAGDPGPYYWATAGIDRCTYAGAKKNAVARNSAGTLLFETNPMPKNVMSYFMKPGFPDCTPSWDTRCGRPNISAGQALSAREAVRSDRSYLLQ